ncbi:sugar transferase [Nocardioides sp. HM23]|uniref:sugar transferase n=1 Tax=Nocardioides bizhenqiangii TaxID=3095076 RepID=UPI002ACAD0CC|nr:sugar transferase [Nocardioides sp. HM23]MDZ5621527.1 sugar transferase [Nocardioides sp. HM23]
MRGGVVAADRAVTTTSATRAKRGSRVVKATLDAVLAALLLVWLSPLLLLLMLAVRLDSAGPAVFRQVRVGKDGRHFEVLKLRTMVDGAEDLKGSLLAANESDGGVLFKIRRDPRITRLGALLRRSSLDELPQLVNVLRGEMSLVGPRPALPDEVAVMDEEALRRFTVRPGMTGLWQVSGRSNLGWSEARAFDTYYADNWTVRGDLAILVRTAKAVVTAEGAC